MVSGSTWHQGGTLSHTLTLLTALQVGHCEEGTRGQKDEVKSEREKHRERERELASERGTQDKYISSIWQREFNP